MTTTATRSDAGRSRAAIAAKTLRTDRWWFPPLVTFVGRARRTSDDGREVTQLDYEAYAEMAERVLDQIATEASDRFAGSVTAVVHRTGVVPLGEAAVAIVTAAPHRSEAYEANRFVIEAIKQRLPIWKRERYADGSVEWVGAGQAADLRAPGGRP